MTRWKSSSVMLPALGFAEPLGYWPAQRSPARSQHDDGAGHLAARHLLERVLDLVERDRLGDEHRQVDATLQVQVDEHREVARRQAVAVPRRLDRTAAPEQLDE